MEKPEPLYLSPNNIKRYALGAPLPRLQFDPDDMEYIIEWICRGHTREGNRRDDIYQVLRDELSNKHGSD